MLQNAMCEHHDLASDSISGEKNDVFVLEKYSICSISAGKKCSICSIHRDRCMYICIDCSKLFNRVEKGENG